MLSRFSIYGQMQDKNCFIIGRNTFWTLCFNSKSRIAWNWNFHSFYIPKLINCCCCRYIFLFSFQIPLFSRFCYLLFCKSAARVYRRAAGVKKAFNNNRKSLNYSNEWNAGILCSAKELNTRYYRYKLKLIQIHKIS